MNVNLWLFLEFKNLWTFYTTSGFFPEVYQQDWKSYRQENQNMGEDIENKMCVSRWHDWLWPKTVGKLKIYPKNPPPIRYFTRVRPWTFHSLQGSNIPIARNDRWFAHLHIQNGGSKRIWILTYCEFIFIRGIPIFVAFVGASKPRIYLFDEKWPFDFRLGVSKVLTTQTFVAM